MGCDLMAQKTLTGFKNGAIKVNPTWSSVLIPLSVQSGDIARASYYFVKISYLRYRAFPDELDG